MNDEASRRSVARIEQQARELLGQLLPHQTRQLPPIGVSNGTAAPKVALPNGKLGYEGEIAPSGNFVFLDLPTKAPERWMNRKDRAEKPDQFIQRVYGDWIGRGLGKSTLRRLDKELYKALANFQHRNGKPLELHLPTLKEMNDAAVRRGTYGDLSKRFSYRTLAAIAAAARRRGL